MRTLTLAETKSHLSAVIDQVQGGEEVVITRRARRVARIVPVRTLDTDDTRALLDEQREFVPAQPEQPRPAGAVVREIREDARY